MRSTLSTLATLTFLLLVRQNSVASYNILGIFPFPGPSHHKIFDALMVELAARGHNVTVYNTFPKSYSLPNYRQVDLSDCFSLPDVIGVEELFSIGTRTLQASVLLTPFMPTEREILDCRPLRELRTSSEPYDLLITETFHNDFFALFAHTLRVPLIVVQTFASIPWTSVQTGLPDNPSYLPHLHHRHFNPQNFWSRVQNVILYLNSLYFYKFESDYVYDKIAAKFFGPGTPSTEEVIRNASLMLVNSHHSYQGARPLVPNVVDVGGINIKPTRKLPQDIEKFINESTHGVIYFSLGTIIRGKTMPTEKKNAFLRAFSRLPQRVLWKWEEEALPGKTDSIMILKWMPQRDILAHPNVKLFISHCGLLGTSEAVYEGVPVLGIPFFADQPGNIDAIKANGAGERLDYTDISEEVVFEKLSRLLNNPEYRKNAEDMSRRFKDRPMSPLDTAVYWTEYVVRHKGAPHLKTAAVHMPWHRYFLLDVIAFLLLVIVMALFVIYYTVKLISEVVLNMVCGSTVSTKSQKKAKRN